MQSPTLPAEAQTVIPLWNGPAPRSRGSGASDNPSLITFLPQTPGNATPAVIVCPGGGYNNLVLEHEGTHVARWFQDHGVAAFVLQYRLPAHGYAHPVPLLDAQRAIRLVRSHAADWKIDPAKVGFMGFSAGGHLAGTAGAHYDAGDSSAADPIDKIGCRPDFSVLVYPLILFSGHSSKAALLGPDPTPALIESLSIEKQVTAQTPPTLLVHSDDDPKVLVEQSEIMHAALLKAGAPSAFHRYSSGGHGFGYGHIPDRSPAGWLDKVYAWLKFQGLMP